MKTVQVLQGNKRSRKLLNLNHLSLLLNSKSPKLTFNRHTDRHTHTFISSINYSSHTFSTGKMDFRNDRDVSDPHMIKKKNPIYWDLGILPDLSSALCHGNFIRLRLQCITLRHQSVSFSSSTGNNSAFCVAAIATPWQWHGVPYSRRNVIIRLSREKF